jgi:hypothetical protein
MTNLVPYRRLPFFFLSLALGAPVSGGFGGGTGFVGGADLAERFNKICSVKNIKAKKTMIPTPTR